MQSQLREIQDEVANAGWRIKLISHAADGKPVVIGFENWAGYVAVIAMLGFPIGVGMAIYAQNQGQDPAQGIAIAITSWVICMLAVAMKNKLKQADWTDVEAKCIDREVLKVVATQGGPTWATRILCEVNHADAVLQCTPTVHWKTFKTEPEANAFLASRISRDGCCVLKINPKNPLEASLVGRDAERAVDGL